MSGLLVAIPALPLIAAAVVGLAGWTPRTAPRFVVGASVLATIGAVVLLISVAFEGPVDAVITDADGAAVVGVMADRVGAILLLLTSLVGLIVQSFAYAVAGRRPPSDPLPRPGCRARQRHLARRRRGHRLRLAGRVGGNQRDARRTPRPQGAVAGRSPLAAAAPLGASWSAMPPSLIGMIVAIVAVGDLDLRTMGAEAAALDDESVGPLSLVTVVAVCLVIAGIARSALVPLHAWLPSTLAAPTPVSALLHAGVINGAGVLLIRFSPIFASSAGAMALAFAIGIVTALFATAIMLVRTDVKGGLVWSTSGQMGFMVVQLGVGAFAAALFHIVGHALYKASMFLGAGGAISAHSRQNQRPHLGRADEAVRERDW